MKITIPLRRHAEFEVPAGHSGGVGTQEEDQGQIWEHLPEGPFFLKTE